MPESYTQYESRIERGNWEACTGTAKSHGFTQEEAENCEDSGLGCPDCPFKTMDRKAE